MARRRNPYPALIIAALIPAAALGGLWQFADGQKPDALNVAVTAPAVLAEEATVGVPGALRRGRAVASVPAAAAGGLRSAHSLFCCCRGT